MQFNFSIDQIIKAQKNLNKLAAIFSSFSLSIIMVNFFFLLIFFLDAKNIYKKTGKSCHRILVFQ